MADGPETEHTMSDTTTSSTTSTGNGSTDGGGQQADTTTGSDQQQTQNQQQSGGQPSGQQGGSNQQQAGDGDKKFTQADLDKKIDERLRRERKNQGDADAKITAAQQEAQDAKAAHDKLVGVLAEHFGVKKDDAPPDPIALQQTLTQRENRNGELESENAGLRTELAAWKSAVENGANPLYLMDRRSFLDELAKLDRKSDKFGEHLDAAVKAAIERDESLKAATTPRTPRPDPSQGSGRPGPTGGQEGAAEAERRFGKRANTP